jgi:hypothetical protein
MTSYVSYATTALGKSYQTGKVGAAASARRQDIERGWSVARQSLVRNEAASAAKKGLSDVSRRWQIWQEVVQAMEAADARERRNPGCCGLTLFWFQNLFAMFEFFFRAFGHILLVSFWAILFKCKPENPTILANMGYHGIAISSYFASFGVIMYNLGNPGKPAYKFGGYTELDRPVPPLASGENATKPLEEVEGDEIRPLGLLQNLCFVCSAKHPLVHLERYWKSLFCSFSCCHACHPSFCCGPCCMCSRACYNTMPQRVMTWNAKIQAKRDPALLHFYESHLKVKNYEEYVQLRLREMESAPPVSEMAMQRGADLIDLEEGVALGVLEAFVGRGPANGGNPSDPARAALGVVKGILGIAPSAVEEGNAEHEGLLRGHEMSIPVMQAVEMIKMMVGEIAQEARVSKSKTTQAVQRLQDPNAESKEESTHLTSGKADNMV